MLSEFEGKIIQVRASGFGDLLLIVVEQFNRHCCLIQNAYEVNGSIPSYETIKKDYPEHKSISIIAQTFTAMVIEAFYFDYYHSRVSKGKAERWSKQSPLNQFTDLSEKFLKVNHSDQAELYSRLENLNKLRKRWVHNQSTQLGKYKKDLDYYNADGCIQLLREFFEYFYTHDPECLIAKVTLDGLTQVQLDNKGFIGRNK